MKRNNPSVITALSLAGFLASILLVQPARSALRSDEATGASASRSFEDARLGDFEPIESFSGIVEVVSSTNGSFLLSVTKSPMGLPIAIDPVQRGLFSDGSVKVGDWVTVIVTRRVSANGNYAQYLLRNIHVGFVGHRHTEPLRSLPDFLNATKLSITPHRGESGLAFSATTELGKDWQR